VIQIQVLPKFNGDFLVQRHISDKILEKIRSIVFLRKVSDRSTDRQTKKERKKETKKQTNKQTNK